MSQIEHSLWADRSSLLQPLRLQNDSYLAIRTKVFSPSLREITNGTEWGAMGS